MCLAHWNKVSIGTQERVRFALTAYRKGGEWDAYLEAVNAAIAEAT